MRGTVPCTGLRTPLHPPSPGAPPPQPRWPWHGAGGSRVHLSHHSVSPAQTLGHVIPQGCCCQNCGSAAPMRWEENLAGRRGRVQGGGPSRPHSCHPTPSPTLGGQGGGTRSRLPHGTAMAMRAEGVHGQKAARRCAEETHSGEGETRSQTQHRLTSNRTNQRARAAQEFYHRKTTPGRFLLVSPTVYQTPGQPSLASNAGASPRSPGSRRGLG